MRSALSLFEYHRCIRQGLYLYVHKFQLTYPLLHLPTLNLEKVSILILFVMSMVGITFLKTEEVGAFIRRAYPVCTSISHLQSKTDRFPGDHRCGLHSIHICAIWMSSSSRHAGSTYAGTSCAFYFHFDVGLPSPFSSPLPTA